MELTVFPLSTNTEQQTSVCPPAPLSQLVIAQSQLFFNFLEEDECLYAEMPLDPG